MIFHFARFGKQLLRETGRKCCDLAAEVTASFAPAS